MFRNLHASSSVVFLKSNVYVQIIRGLLLCYSIVKNLKTFLTNFTAINANIMNKTIKTFVLSIKNTANIQKT